MYSYASFECCPCRYPPSLTAWCWVLYDTWRAIHPAEIAVGAGVLTEEAYQKRFGSVPALPAEAFDGSS
jgi:hypothetical protein